MAAPKWAGLALLMLVSLGSIVSAQRKVAEEPKWRTYSEFGNSRDKDTKVVDDEKFVLGGHFSLGHGIKIDPQLGSGGFKAAATGGGYGKGGGYGSGENLGVVGGGWSVGGSANIGGGTLGGEDGGSGNDCSGVRLFFDKSNNPNNPHTAPKTMAGSNDHKQYINHETEDRHIVHPIKVIKPPPIPKLTEPLAPQRINMPRTPPPSPQNGMAKLTPVAG